VRSHLYETLLRAKRLCDVVLPQFNWARSALSAESIKLLNEVPGEIDAALKLCDDCPPAGWPTDKTRCAPCPRRALGLPPWDELTPEERLAVVEQIAGPGLSWALRARQVYEHLRAKMAEPTRTEVNVGLLRRIKEIAEPPAAVG
jgi:hypothetical protein